MFVILLLNHSKTLIKKLQEKKAWERATAANRPITVAVSCDVYILRKVHVKYGHKISEGFSSAMVGLTQKYKYDITNGPNHLLGKHGENGVVFN